jgi:hypothetical protein
MASTGHSGTHEPQARQASVILCGMGYSFEKLCLNIGLKNSF